LPKEAGKLHDEAVIRRKREGQARPPEDPIAKEFHDKLG